ncbi:superoxide dismutase family protein [Niabella beijingensis]|uniref:superoxide dismutase family protein n=1 Tax=Niabella beijingensis TaxID=2872700 RepID=UPI001CBB947F|nr:superoxide dismutase family protein [Niabella beijingensis]MBZ4191533.1 superoxide dismutase family protein [Niabella beijingensis]
MKKSFFAVGTVALMILASCGNSASDTKTTDSTGMAPVDTGASTSTAPAPEGTQVAVANLQLTADSTKHIGTAKFYKLTDGKIRLDLEIDLKERADSNVAVHFHEHGDCGMKGENSHGHWNPTKSNHGEWGSAAFHSGDIGNIKLDASGHATKSVTTDLWSVDPGEKEIIGRAIIVHGGTDDYKTQPTGNSGPRIGCGVITKP